MIDIIGNNGIIAGYGAGTYIEQKICLHGRYHELELSSLHNSSDEFSIRIFMGSYLQCQKVRDIIAHGLINGEATIDLRDLKAIENPLPLCEGCEVERVAKWGDEWCKSCIDSWEDES